MSAESFKRKLTAILSADVKGYSRLMGEDEVATVRTLKEYRELMSKLIKESRGRVVDSPGDNVLAEFASVVDALQCSIEIQKELKSKNAALPDNRKMSFRIGVNLGDVIEDEDRVYGDGVNIAARIEGLAEPGGICISGSGFEQVRNKLQVGYQYLGEHTVKNIVHPVKVYRVLMEPEHAGKVIGEKGPKRIQWSWAAVAAVILAGAALALWNFYFRPPPIEPASKEKMAFPLPDVPSIAVLPFVNMSEDPKQEVLSDGITESITTALSKLRNLFVISRQSAFTYKGKPVTVKQVSEELGVQYVLEGSVQKSADRIRITAQLIDALKGHHIWAERYDRDVTDLFALQDEITLKIVRSMALKLTHEDQLLAAGKSGEKLSLDCFMKINEGLKVNESLNIEAARAARRVAEEAIAMCPEVPMTYVLMGFVHQMEFIRMLNPPQDAIEKGIEMAQKALAMDDSISVAHSLLCSLYILRGELDKGITEGERAVALDPNGAFAYSLYGWALSAAGRSEEAIITYQKAIRLNPIGASMLVYSNFAYALRSTGRFEEAVSADKKGLQTIPDNMVSHVGLAATYSMMGREKEARAEAAEVLRLSPRFSLELYRKRLSIMRNQAEVDHFIDALRKAGLK